MAKAGAIEKGKTADFTVLLGITKPEKAKAIKADITEEEDIIEISDAPNISEVLDPDEMESDAETAETNIESTENGAMEE
jgi:hypothetical protein